MASRRAAISRGSSLTAQMAAALFQYNNVRDRFRASIPLDRIVSVRPIAARLH